jgi:serine/threonine protein kinase
MQIHKNIYHKNIVGFKHFFEDSDNIYIILELCEKKSLWDLILNRRDL